jgi:hypothetical protein
MTNEETENPTSCSAMIGTEEERRAWDLYFLEAFRFWQGSSSRSLMGFIEFDDLILLAKQDADRMLQERAARWE